MNNTLYGLKLVCLFITYMVFIVSFVVGAVKLVEWTNVSGNTCVGIMGVGLDVFICVIVTYMWTTYVQKLIIKHDGY